MPTATANVTFYPLEHLSLLGIQGSDALTFLQGQGTQDYRRLSETSALPGAFCTPKGRAVSNVWNVLLEAEPAHLKLVLHASTAPLLQQHLAKYIPFFRGSKLTDDRLNYHGLGITGDGDAALMNDWFGAPAHHGVWTRNGHFAFALPDGRTQLWLDARADSYEDWLTRVEQYSIAPTSAWQQLDIAAAQPWIEAAQSGAFVPQTIGLEDSDGISFRKGCYTGQEVVARLHFKGQSKRGMVRVQWQGKAEPTGTELFGNTGPAGEWINWIGTDSGGAGLAVVRNIEAPTPLFIDADRQIAVQVG
ncbi:YgfZ/GcvT domain-containing protein [Saccharospirillum mangrovi]|uniref:CAF17-like 4Fe-4S cluster assembly/insertion protein YgfZ n=1 Tax=Saccharospirillum mangrovi TaxID=2161747 RepID=UPI000D39DFEE|nr:folate-binding protein YgfZ [Saccharospirillum mangrovi]